MGSRDRIVAKLKAARRKNDVLPEPVLTETVAQPLEKLTAVLQSIGGRVVTVSGLDEIINHLLARFPEQGRWVSMVPGLSAADAQLATDPHLLENVQLAIIGGHFAVAENGAVWVTSEVMGDRALPFICEHLAIVVRQGDVVETMRHAYQRIGNSLYDFGTFIAGPSKTADIEQSLVLGAHGPKSMSLFLIP